MAQVAHLQHIYVRSDTTAPTGTDEVAGLTEFSGESSKTTLDQTDFKDTSGAKIRLMGLEDGSFTLSGDWVSGDAPQNLIRSSFDSGALIYLTVHYDTAASAGSKGYRYLCVVDKYAPKMGVDGKVEWSANLAVSGAKLAI